MGPPLKPQQKSGADLYDPFADSAGTGQEPSGADLYDPFSDEPPRQRYVGPERKPVEGTMGDFVKGASRKIAQLPRMIAGLPDDIVGIFNNRGLTAEQKKSSTARSYLIARLGYTQKDIDALPTAEDRSIGQVAKEAGEFAIAIPKAVYEGTKKLTGAPTMAERGEGLGEALLGTAGLVGVGKIARDGYLKSSGRDAGPAPPDAPALTGEVGGPKSKPPTPEQVAERTTKLAELEAKSKAAEQTKKTAAGDRLRSAQKWNALTAAERKLVYPELAEADLGKRWSELSGETKTSILEKWVSQNKPVPRVQDAPAAQGGTAVVPVSGAPKAPTPVAGVPTLVEAVRNQPLERADIDAIGQYTDDKLVEELYLTSSVPNDPAMPHLEAEAERRGIDIAKSVESASLVKKKQTPGEERLDRMMAPYKKAWDEAQATVLDPNATEAHKTAAYDVMDTIREKVMDLQHDEVYGVGSEKKVSKATVDELIATPKPPPIPTVDSALQRLADDLGVDPSGLIQAAVDRALDNPARTAEAVGKIADAEEGVAGHIEPAQPEPSSKPISQRGKTDKPTKKGKKEPRVLSIGEPTTPTTEALPPAEIPPADLPRAEGPSGNEVETARAMIDELERQLDEIYDREDLTDAQRLEAVKENQRQRQHIYNTVPGVREVVNTSQYRAPMPRTLGKELNTFTTTQLLQEKRAIEAAVQDPKVLADQKAILQAELDRIIKFAKGGLLNNEKGFVVNPFARRRAAKTAEETTLTEAEKHLKSKVILEPDVRNDWNWVKLLRAFHMGYTGTLRASHPINVAVKLYETKTGQTVPGHLHAGKQMEMMDGSLTKAEGWLRGDGPQLPDGMGGVNTPKFVNPEGILEPAKSLAGVVETAGKDVEKLGWLWAASRAIELKMLYNRNLGIDLGHAYEIYKTYPQALHDAVREGRNYHMALAQLGHMTGLVSAEALTKFAEETAYGPIMRIFDDRLMQGAVKQMEAGGKSPKEILASQPFKHLKGSDRPMLNMVESSIVATYRILRASNLNNFSLSLVNMARERPNEFKGIIEPADFALAAQIKKQMKLKQALVKEMFDETGIDITDDHANLFANVLADDAIRTDGGVLQVYNNGEVELWRVSPLIAESIRSMSPIEQNWALRTMGGKFNPNTMGFLGAPARSARLGVVFDPLFMLNQMVIDQFQGWFNTNYGFIPVYDSFRGWWHLVRESEVAKEAMKAGGVERSGLRNRTGLAEVLAGPQLSPLPLAHQEIINFHPLKAIGTLLSPIREATRMGEYLRARGAGASPIEASWAARDLLGNYSMQGSFMTIRALNYISAFGRPALAVIDKTARVIGKNPGRWFFRGAVTLGLGALLLYLANEDDEEINNLRRTPAGQRWFYFRINGKIVKARKPYGEGAIFASGVEAMLDKWRANEPDAFNLWAKAVKQEFQVNALPVVGVMAYEMKSNKSWQTGTPIVPEDEMALDPEYRVGYRATSADRVIGESLSISPAMINYVMRTAGGYLGEDIVLAVSTAMDWNRTGELPPAEDWPFMQRLFARYPSYGVQPVRKFYENADKIDQAAKTLEMVYQDRPDRLMIELQQHGSITELAPLIETFNNTRQEIADLRRSAEWLDPLQDIGPATKALYRKSFIERIILKAHTANLIADPIMKANENARRTNKITTTTK